MKNLKTTAVTLSLIAGILAGGSAENAEAEPVTTLFVTVGAAGGAWIGGAVGAKAGIALGGVAMVATISTAAVGAEAGAVVMDAAAAVAGPVIAALGPKTPVAPRRG